MKPPQAPGPSLYLTLALVSAGGLAYEILLLRVFSYSQWHHFASLAVSLALLGFGAAGTLLAVLGRRAVRWGDGFFLAGLLIGALGMIAAYLLPQAITVRPLFAVWDYRELGKLLLLDFVSFVPFFGLALCIGQVFIRWPEHTPRLYAANLLGSGLGSLAATLLLSVVPLETALLLVPLAVLAAGGAFALFRPGLRLPAMGAVAGACALALWIATGPPNLPLSDFKRLSYLLDLPDAIILEEKPGLREKTTVVRSDSIRMAPGLSLQWLETVPSQDALVLGADPAIPVPRTREDTDYLRATLGAAPFVLRPEGPVAALGTSGWLSFLQAGNRSVTWVEENPEVVDAFASRDLLEGIRPRTEVAGRFLSASGEQYAIIVLEAASTGGDAAGEDYTLTVGGLRRALDRLGPSGVLAVPLRLQNPPRHAPKLIATAVEALRANGIEAPWEHAAMLRSMREGLLLLSNEPFGTGDQSALRDFADRWGFDLVALPGLTEAQANRFHRLPEPVYYRTARALLADDGKLPPEVSWYLIDPATDLRPYFWRSMRWGEVPDMLTEYGKQALIWLDWSLLVTVVKLIVAAALAVLLILAPLGKLPAGRAPQTRSRVALYFFGIGLGFLMLELAIFQRAILFLGHPVPTASLIFAVFLVGSGLGSLTAPTSALRRTVHSIFGPIFGFAVLAALVLSFTSLLHLPYALRLGIVGLGVAPLAWFLGRAMPWGLRQLDTARPLIPWAWGVNGFASVLAAPAAVLLSVQFAQPVTWIAALACYGVAWMVGRSWIQ